MKQHSQMVRMFGLAVASLAVSSGAAFSSIWTNPTVGNWAISSNWFFGIIPTSSQNADIDNGGLALVTATDAAASNLYLGETPSSGQSGFVDVQGAGALSIGSGIYVYNGTLRVTSGAVASASSTDVGLISGPGVGTVLVTDTNSRLFAGTLNVNSGASLQIQNGGTVYAYNSSFPASVLGGTATVTGLNSLWSIGGRLSVGNANTTVSNRGKINAGSSTISGSSTVKVTGAGSAFNNSDSSALSYIGSLGTGALVVRDGALATGVNTVVGLGGAFFGSDVSGTGYVTVADPGSTWNNSGDVSVGTSSGSTSATGTGDMNVALGGHVTSATTEMGVAANCSGTVNVDGAGSSWANSGDVAIGQSGIGSLEISNGGKFSNFRAHLGFNPGASGSVTVHDPGSTWTGGGSFFIGNGGSGSLQVRNSSLASTAGNAYLGFSPGASGTALVSGVGSTFNVTATLAIGGNLAASGGQGSLRIEDFGTVNTGSTILYNSGVLELSGAVVFTGPMTSYGGLVRTFGDTAISNNITLGAGGINVSQQTADGTSTLSGAISGSGGLTYSATDATSTLRLTGNSNYTGATTLNSGTMIVDGSITSAITVSNGTKLAGSGTVGPITISSGGTISPGSSAGSLTTGDAQLNGGGSYSLDLRSDGTGTVGVDWDSIAVNGALDISALSSQSPFVVTLHTLDSTDNRNPLDAWDPAISHAWSSIIGTTGGLVGDFDPSLFQIDAADFQNPTNGTFSLTLDGSNLDLLYTAAQIAGDFDGDGVVGPEDYDIWAASFGSMDDLRADANHDGIVDGADYVAWRHASDQLGAGNSATLRSSESLSASVPEPRTAVLLLLVGLGLGVRRVTRKNLPLRPTNKARITLPKHGFIRN